MAMPPSQDMPPQAPAAEASDEGAGDQPSDPKQLLIEVHTGLAKILQVAQKAGAPESAVKQLQMSLDYFRSGVEEMMSGGGGAPAGQVQHQVAPSEVGGNPNARPM